MALSALLLQQIVAPVYALPAARAQAVWQVLEPAMAAGSVNTRLRQAAFLAQIAHESGGFRYTEELASGDAYEGRLDLGNTQPGDGRRYKGRGYIQLTGRANYAEASRDLGLDLLNFPELAAQANNAARIAVWYWNKRGLNGLADKGPEAFDSITRRINGALRGKAERDAIYQRALQSIPQRSGFAELFWGAALLGAGVWLATRKG